MSQPGGPKARAARTPLRMVPPGCRPELRKQIAQGQKQMAVWAMPLISALGSRSPQRHLRLILSFVDGMLGNQLANPQRGFDPAAGIAILLRGLFAPGDVGYPTIAGVDVPPDL